MARPDTSTTEAFLFGYRDAIRERETIQAKLDILQTEMLPKSPSLTGMPGAASYEDRMASYMARLEEQQQKWIAAMNKATQAMIKIEGVINRVEDAELRQLLQYRYMNGYHWDIIAESMNYSGQYIYELRVKALSCVANILEQSKTE